MRVACVLLLAVALSACYQSTLPLGPPERGTFDSALVGSWSCVDPRDATNRAFVTSVPVDRHRYEIEWREAPDHVTHYRACATKIEEALKGLKGSNAIREMTTRVSDPTLYGPTCTATVRRP